MAKKKLTIEDVLVPKDEIPYEVPENWCWVKLGSICEIIRGVSYKKTDVKDYESNTCMIARGGNIQNGLLVECDDNVYIDFNLVKEKQFLKKGDVLIVASTGSNKLIGKAALIDNNYSNKAFGAFIINIRPNDKINKRYFGYYFLSDYYTNYIRTSAAGVNINNINGKHLENILFPIPPLAEQERIVNRIESLFDKVDKAAGLVDEARDGFEKRRAAILERAFSGELTKKWREENGVSDEWEVIKFKELGKLERGRSKHRPRNDERLFGGPYPFIQTGDIANSNGYIYHHKQTLSEFGLDQSRLFPKGTLCITIAANIGDVAILTYDCCFPDSVVGFTPNDDVESKFIYYYLNLIKRDLEHYAPATAQKNINLAILGALDIPKPSVEEQRQIVDILDKVLNKNSKVEELIDLEDNIELVKKAILAKAFRGELDSNKLNEESSIKFLEELV